MFLAILILSALWDFGGTCGDRGPVERDVTEHRAQGLPPEGPHDSLTTKISQRDLWELISSSRDVIPVLVGRNVWDPGTADFYEPAKDSSTTPIPSHRNLQIRLRKLDYYFSALGIKVDDCRQRLICELARDPRKFSPLSVAFLDETRYNGDEKVLSARLLASAEGTKLLAYIQAAQRGNDQKACEVWFYRCPQATESMINYQTLLMWREVSKWLTIKMVSKYN